MPHTLTAENTAFSYEPGRMVFSGISAKIRGGAITGVVGPNGAGKSTLLRLLCGILPCEEGAILLDGAPLSDLGDRERAKQVALLPQLLDPSFAFTAHEVVCLGRYPYTGLFGTLSRHDVSVAGRCSREVGVESLGSRDFLTLSGGERQRVLLASLLAQEPGVMLLDEPTSALDLHHEIEFFSLLRRLAEDGYGVGVVTHDLNLAARFCDTLLLMPLGTGGLLASGPPEAVLTEDLLSEAYAGTIRVGENPLTGSPLITAMEPKAKP